MATGVPGKAVLAGFADAIDVDAVFAVFDDRVDFGQQFIEMFGSDAAFEDAALNADAIALHQPGHAPQPPLVRDVVGDQNQHCSAPSLEGLIGCFAQQGAANDEGLFVERLSQRRPGSILLGRNEIEFGVDQSFVFAQEVSSRLVAEPHSAVFRAREFFRRNDAEVEQIDRQPVTDQRAELFHQIERQRTTAETRLVKKSEIGIASDRGQGADRFVVEQRVAETQERIDRIGWRTPGAFIECDAAAKHPGQPLEMDRRGLSFDASQTVARTDRLRPLFQYPELRGFLFEIAFRMVALMAREHRLAIGDLAGDEAASHGGRKNRFVHPLVLPEPQRDVFGFERRQSALQLSVHAQEGRVNSAFEQKADGRGCQLNIAEDDDAFDLEFMNLAQLATIPFDHQTILFLADARTLFCQIECCHKPMVRQSARKTPDSNLAAILLNRNRGLLLHKMAPE